MYSNPPYRILLCLYLVFGLVTSLFAASTFQPETLWPQVTQSGRYFNFPIGIAQDQNKLFYITDSQSHRVKVLTEQGEFLRSWGGFGQASGKFDKPLGIAIAPNGLVYVADTNNNRIQKFNNQGQLLGQWGGLGRANGQLDHPNTLTVDLQGRIFVGDTGNHRIQVFNASGQWIRSFGGLGSEPGKLNNPVGIAISVTGEVYVVEGPNNHRISVFDVQGKYLRSWGQKGASDGQLDSPEGIALDNKGQVYISEFGNNRIQVFTNDGKWLRSWGKLGFTGADLWSPFGMVIDADNKTLYVADASNNRVQFYDLSGKYIGGWQSQSNGPGEFAAPKMSISPQGEVYVADQRNHRIQKFSATGEWQRSFGAFGTEPGQFNGPNHVAFSKNGKVFIADTGNDRIQVYDQNGTYLSHWGVTGKEKGQLDGPGNLTMGSDGLLYITELINHRVSVFTADGQFVRAWGKFGSGRVELNRPDGIVIDENNVVYVADHDNHRVQVFDIQGNYLNEWGQDGSEPGNFNHPHGIALSPSGLLYVTDALNNRIQVFKKDGTLVEIIGEAGTQPGQLGQPYTVELTDDDTLYVSELANNRIQLLKRRDSSARTAFKAILLAGGGPSTETYENPIWESTELLTNNAYFALRAQGINKESIRYLTAGNTQNDLDGDGLFTDTLSASNASLQQAITSWASDADNVIIYLADHGGDGTFKINQHDILTSKLLKEWLDAMDGKVPGKVTVIIEACQSGSFFADLSHSNHFLIASANSQQPAIISNEGLTAFSYHFWYAVHTGSSLQNAFKRARQGISRETVLVGNKLQQQDAQLDGNGDGKFDANDYTSVGTYCLGKCTKTAADEPQVLPITISSNLNGQSQFHLRMQVTSLSGVSRAWALISRPDINYSDPSQPISELPMVKLACSDQNNGKFLCEGDYDQFSVLGDYHISFHASDQQNRNSLSNEAIVLSQNGTSNGLDNNQSDNSRYDFKNGLLSIQDVLAHGQHYQAVLHYHDDRYELISNSLAKVLFDPSAQYSGDTGLLSLPKVQVQGHYYQATLKNVGNFVFTLLSIKELDADSTGGSDHPHTGVDETPTNVTR